MATNLPPGTPVTPSPVAPSTRRRRKQGNPLLLRIFGVAVLVHIIALPILARFGAFKKVQKEFFDTKMVVLPPAEKVKPEKAVEKKAHPKVAHHASGASHAHAASGARHSALSQPKVVASAGSGGGDDGGPTVSNDGAVGAGQLPTAMATPAPKPTPEATPEAPVAPTVKATPQPEATPQPAPTPAPTPKPPPVFTEAAPVDEIKPSIPDSLRSDAIDATVIAEFQVGADGVPTGVRITQSSGNSDLDDLALKTAKQWRFKPATRDGQAVDSIVRLHIEFQVN